VARAGTAALAAALPGHEKGAEVFVLEKTIEDSTLPKFNWALTIDSRPYTAYPVTWGRTFPYGGIAIDTETRVLETEENLIPGLYASGETSGNFFNHNYPGGASLIRGAVFGRIDGGTAATEATGL
jgi:tricarballylate dehydrogenase